jgi:hypothetical protein
MLNLLRFACSRWKRKKLVHIVSLVPRTFRVILYYYYIVSGTTISILVFLHTQETIHLRRTYKYILLFGSLP